MSKESRHSIFGELSGHILAVSPVAAVSKIETHPSTATHGGQAGGFNYRNSTYEDFLQKRFFAPLGMTETSFWPSDAQVARLAGAYGPDKEKNGSRSQRAERSWQFVNSCDLFSRPGV